jgi:DNA-binding CsgD family transcriptional regulator
MWAALFEAELAEASDGAGADHPGTDVAAWRSAVEATAAPTAPGFLAPYALLRQAEAELAVADRAAARASLQAAFDVAESGGVGAVRDRTMRVAAAAGIALGGVGGGAGLVAPAGGVAGSAASDADAAATAELTARERQVLELIAEGLSNRQIGERLFISGKTASVHVSAILRKLGAATRTEAAYRAGALR